MDLTYPEHRLAGQVLARFNEADALGRSIPKLGPPFSPSVRQIIATPAPSVEKEASLDARSCAYGFSPSHCCHAPPSSSPENGGWDS
eukprot:6445210-Pyramimonas_sp.AAC.1